MKTLLCIVTILFLTSKAEAYPFYYYQQDKIHTSRAQFLRYIRPQLKSMTTEFRYILKKIEPIQHDLMLIRSRLQKINSKWNEWSTKCTKNETLKCQQDLENLYKKTRKLDRQILAIQKKGIKRKKRAKIKVHSNDNIDTYLALLRTSGKLSILNYNFLHSIEKTLINFRFSSRNRKKLANMLHRMESLVDILITSQIDRKFRDAFEFLWVQFIRDVDKYVIINKNEKFILDNIPNLNMAWNSFNMKISKGNIKLPASSRQIVRIMHNRWNSILKFYLKHANFVDSEK